MALTIIDYMGEQFTSMSIQERLEEIDVLLDNGAIPVYGWQELHAERDALLEIRWEAHGALNRSAEDGELIFTSVKFAEDFKLNQEKALGAIEVDGNRFYVAEVETSNS